MAIWIGLLLLHGLYWGAGAAILRRSDPATRLLSGRHPHWFAAYFLGLVPNVVLAFVINQFLNLRLSLLMLVGLAFALFVLAVLFSRGRATPDPSDHPEEELWSWREFVLCGLVATVWARRHTFKPISNWDAFMYHLPFGRLVSEGQFPSEIGRSYILQLEAAYPPLFYFQYGLNALIKTPDVTYLAPQVMVAVTNGLICAATYYFARRKLKTSSAWGLVAALGVALTINLEPNVQSVTTLYVMLAIYYSWDAFWKQKDLQTPRICSCLIPAIFWSGCYWCSYLGLPIIALFFLGVAVAGAWSRVHGERQRVDWTRAAVASAIIALVVVPHPWRNWMVIGNPLYPAFLSLLGGNDITDWFLANRPPAAYPIDGNWRFLLLESAFKGTPLVHIILAGATAILMLRTTLSGSRRVLLFVMLVGFLAVLFRFFHLHNTPWARYLYPAMPLASAVIAAHCSALWNRSIGHVVITSGYLWGFAFLAKFSIWRSAEPLLVCLLLVMFGPLFADTLMRRLGKTKFADTLMRRLGKTKDERDGPGSEVRHHAGSVYMSILVIVFILAIGTPFVQMFTWAWLAIVGSGLILMTLATWHTGVFRRISLHMRWAVVVAGGVVVLAVHSDWQGCNTYQLAIDDDVKWMNENLSPDDVVLLFDGRVALHLERTYFALDDVRLEPFDKAGTPRQAMKELQRLGITHFYFSDESSNLLSDSIRKKGPLLTPAKGSEIIDILYRSKNRWVARFQHDRWSRLPMPHGRGIAVAHVRERSIGD